MINNQFFILLLLNKYLIRLTLDTLIDHSGTLKFIRPNKKIISKNDSS